MMIKTENLSKVYRQGTKELHAVEEANINITEGERVYIHGPSGAGKSTFLHILGGLDVPSKGTVEFRGKDVYRLSDRKRSRLRNASFGFIFQFYHLLPELNVLENVMLPAMIKGGRSRKDVRGRAMSLLERVDMQGRLKHKPSRLSGGEAQRTAIARALVNMPEVLFCDEPTGNLDSEMSEEIYSLIRDISQDNGMSVVVVSHQDVGKDFFNSEFTMKDGKLERVMQEETVSERMIHGA
ncbi:ABC transporter ATP-binding protein [Candidatus Omnitrophota bacterium]